MSWDKTLCPGTSCFRTSFSALSRFVQRPVPDFGYPVPSCPKFWLSQPCPSHGKIFFLSLCSGTMKELLSLCPKKLHFPVPLETLILMPCPFTSPKMFFASPNFLCRTKNLFTYCARPKDDLHSVKLIFVAA